MGSILHPQFMQGFDPSLMQERHKELLFKIVEEGPLDQVLIQDQLALGDLIRCHYVTEIVMHGKAGYMAATRSAGAFYSGFYGGVTVADVIAQRRIQDWTK